VLAGMYGSDYAASSLAAYETDAGKDDAFLMDLLREIGPGRFLDFGCGTGELLEKAASAGWDPVGVELDQEICTLVAERVACPVLSWEELRRRGRLGALVVHLGDVIEHLPDPSGTLAELLRQGLPGGFLVARGPLEANFTLYTLLMRIQGLLRQGREVEMPPWHLLQATARGQRELFRRCGLEELRFEVIEVDWPAPSRRPPLAPGSFRALALYLLRAASKRISRLSGGRWGNRYFYLGRLTGSRFSSLSPTSGSACTPGCQGGDG